VRPSVCEVALANQTLTLQPRVVQVLVVLAQAGGRVVSREELLARCWLGVVVGDDAVGRCIGRLRRLSEFEAPGAFTILTQARVGYRLVTANPDGDRACEPEAAVAAPADPLESRLGPVAKSPSAGTLRLMAGLAAALTLGALAVVLAVTHPPRSAYRIAVRDFKVHGVEAALGETLADRVAAAVNDRGLPIVARFRSRRGDLDGARYIVGGDVRRVGDALTVDVELDDARSGLALWNATVVRPLSQSEALQDQVAGQIADLISVVRRFLGPDETGATPEALAALFKAAEIMRRGGDSRLETREAFRRYRELAPASSKAHSAFAMATARSLNTQPADVAAQWRLEAVSEARQAIALDPKNGEGYTALGLLAPRGDLVQRETWFSKGLSVDPNDASLCNFLGNLLLEVGRAREALPWLQRSLTLDPLSPPKTIGVIYALAAADHFGETQALIAKAQRLWPADPATQSAILSISLIHAPPTQALDTLGRFQAGAHPMPNELAAAWMAFEHARQGTVAPAKAKALLAPLIAEGKIKDIDVAIAALALIGDADDAFRAIDSVRASHRLPLEVLFDSATASLRMDPRFKPIAQETGLSDYWRKTGHGPDFCDDTAAPLVCSGLRPE
jgi:DNA-binding winged helix-turn-helix (wHTH) protein/tetratricopeptide (TPR) repeat protein